MASQVDDRTFDVVVVTLKPHRSPILGAWAGLRQRPAGGMLAHPLTLRAQDARDLRAHVTQVDPGHVVPGPREGLLDFLVEVLQRGLHDAADV